MIPGQGLRASLGRADLVSALTMAEDVTTDFIASQLGLTKVEPRKAHLDSAVGPGTSRGPERLAGPPALRSDVLSPLRLWVAQKVSFFDTEGEAQVTAFLAPPPYRGWRGKPRRAPIFHPLTTWSELVPRLRRVLSEYREGRAIDLGRAVDAISRGRILARLPRERRRRWGPALMLLEDDSRRLVPFRIDRRLIRGVLSELLPAHTLGRALVAEGQLLAPRPTADSAISWPPPAGTLVLALSDIGCLATGGASLRAAWLALGREVADAGCHPLALFPGPLQRCPRALRTI